MSDFFNCNLCGGRVAMPPADNVMDAMRSSWDHFRLVHPDVWAEIKKWPDGTPVVVDESLRPDDFGEQVTT